MKSLVSVSIPGFLATALVLSAGCRPPERDYLGGAGGEGGAGSVDETSASGGKGNATDWPDGSGGGAIHEEGTPLSPAIPSDLEEVLIWNALVDSKFFLNESATGVTWAVTEGKLPEGLTLRSDGTLRGRAQELGAFELTIQATSSSGDTGELQLTLLVESRSWIAYVIADNKSDSVELTLADLAQGTSTVLENAPGSGRFGNLSFSPDGKSFAYLVDEDGDPSNCVVKLVQLTKSSPSSRVVGSAKAPCDETFRWSPDGSAFVHLRFVSASTKAPALVRSRNGKESYFILTNQASTTATNINWLSDTLVLFDQATNSPDLWLDVTEDAMRNPRTLASALTSKVINPFEQRYGGRVADGFEVMDFDDDWSRSFSATDRTVSPGLHYSLTEQPGPVLEIHELASLGGDEPAPIASVERDYHKIGSERFVFFAGLMDEYLAGFSQDTGEGAGVWELNLDQAGAVKIVLTPSDCVPRQLNDSDALHCATSGNGYVQTYVYRPGLDEEFHATLVPNTFSEPHLEPSFSPDGTSVLQVVTDAASGQTSVQRFKFPELKPSNAHQRLSPLNDPTAVDAAIDVNVQPIWTGDGVFAVFVMDRKMSASVVSSAVWAQMTTGTANALNVSASNTSCGLDPETLSGNDCLQVTRLVSQAIQSPRIQ